MSSMRNAVQRRNHKERAQPQEREKWGILEKHKDYSLRAKDYNAKQKRLKTLRQKAADRNPDEFHFAMMSSETHNGIRRVRDQESRPLDQETVKLLKTQDAGYLRTMLQSTRKARVAMEQELLLKETTHRSSKEESQEDDFADGNEHLVFVESEGSIGQQGRLSKADILTLADHSHSSLSANAGRKTGSPERSTATDTQTKARELDRRRKRAISAGRNRLEALRKREEALAQAEQELELQRGRLQNSVGSVNQNGVRFRIRERKR